MHFKLIFLLFLVVSKLSDCELNYERYRRSVPESSAKTDVKYNPIYIEKPRADLKNPSDDVIKNVLFRFMCLDEKLDLLGLYKDVWNCEMIKEIRISRENTFECSNSYIKVQYNAKHPDPAASAAKLTTVKKEVTGYLTPDYGEFEQEQSYSDCKHIRR
jgi:hypothetical protein